jgi:hypothetical protein
MQNERAVCAMLKASRKQWELLKDSGLRISQKISIYFKSQKYTLYYRDRGVKVELGIPYDLWDTPSAEITQLKKYVKEFC